jgi:hypothetical protein
MGRKIRTIHQALIPTLSDRKTRKPSPQKGYTVGTPVYARGYRADKSHWAEGIISGRRGKVLYEVSVKEETWIRHKNQVRLRFAEQPRASSLPLDVLLDTFRLPSQSVP